jgi:hypothetical protein
MLYKSMTPTHLTNVTQDERSANMSQFVALSSIVLITCLLSGCGSSADPKQVAANPSNYAGKTVESNLRLMGFGEGGAGFKDPNSDTYVFSLRTPGGDIYQKLIKLSQLAGDSGSVIVTYKVDDNVKVDSASIGQILDVSSK